MNPVELSRELAPRESTSRGPLKVTLSPEAPIWETWEGTPSRSGWRRSFLPVGGSVSFRRKRVSSPRVGNPALSLVHALRAVSPGGGENALRSDGRGIDLAIRGGEVRKLFYAAFARGLVKDGFDPEEALQEVYKGLLARNRGTCPFDVKKSSFGHYVHIVTRCVLANYVRKEKKRVHHEVSGEGRNYSPGEPDKEWEIPVPPNQEDSRRGQEYLREKLARILPPRENSEPVLRALDLLAQGYSRREAAQLSQVDYKRLGSLLESMKQALSPLSPVSE